MKTGNKKGSKFKKWKPGKEKNKRLKPTNRQNKLHIKFDLHDRREYLTGFQKRKKERKERAYKQLQDGIKAEKKRIKKERKDIMDRMIQQGHELMEHGGIGVIDDDDDDDKETNKFTLNCGSTTVEICDLDLTSKSHLGINQMELNTDDSEKNKKDSSNKAHKKDDTQEENEEEDVSSENLERLGIRSERDLRWSLKKSSAKVLKHSRLLKQKQLRDATKQRKAQARENNRRKKIMSKKMRHKHLKN